jgi:HAD superfamily hydrolase (TIGR01509 family)
VTELIIFDCDGVLVDSEILTVQIESRHLADVGIALTPAEVAARYVGLSTTSMVGKIRDEFGVELTPDFWAELRTEVLAELGASLSPVPGIGSVLEASELPRCIASSSDPERIALSLRTAGLSAAFAADRIFSATMVERGKPAPDLFLHAASRCGATPQRCVVVEDSPSGVQAGVAAGMTVVGLTAGGHCPPDHAARLSDAGAHSVVGACSDLLDHF